MSSGRYEVSDRILGTGSFGKILSGIDKETETEVAIKIQSKNNNGYKRMKSISQEFLFLSELDHPNIIKTYGGYETENDIYLILSLVKGGDLHDFMNVRSCGLSIEESRNIFTQLLSAVEYCHSKNIIHRDVKMENILIHDKDASASNCTISLCDFGFATYNDKESKLKDYPGSPRYAAPELVRGRPYRGRPVDVWGMGMVLYGMSQKTLPFQDPSIEKTQSRILSAKLPPITDDPKLVNLVERMLDKNPKTRITTDQIKLEMF